jgi:hypothetical protein
VAIGISAPAASAARWCSWTKRRSTWPCAAAGLTTQTESFEGVEAGFHATLDLGAFALGPQVRQCGDGSDGATSDGANALYIQVPDFLWTFVFDAAFRAFSLDVISALKLGGNLVYSPDNVTISSTAVRRPRSHAVPQLHRSDSPVQGGPHLRQRVQNDIGIRARCRLDCRRHERSIIEVVLGRPDGPIRRFEPGCKGLHSQRRSRADW